MPNVIPIRQYHVVVDQIEQLGVPQGDVRVHDRLNIPLLQVAAKRSDEVGVQSRYADFSCCALAPAMAQIECLVGSDVERAGLEQSGIFVDSTRHQFQGAGCSRADGVMEHAFHE